MIKISFPEGYKVRCSNDVTREYTVAVPKNHAAQTLAVIKEQDWVAAAYRDSHRGNIFVLVNEAYVATNLEVVTALETLCKYTTGLTRVS